VGGEEVGTGAAATSAFEPIRLNFFFLSLSFSLSLSLSLPLSPSVASTFELRLNKLRPLLLRSFLGEVAPFASPSSEDDFLLFLSAFLSDFFSAFLSDFLPDFLSSDLDVLESRVVAARFRVTGD
jgi:hypothetical protein